MMKTLNALVAAAAVSCVMVSGTANAYTYNVFETYTVDFSVNDNFLYFDNESYAFSTSNIEYYQSIESEANSDGLLVSAWAYQDQVYDTYYESFGVRYHDREWYILQVSHEAYNDEGIVKLRIYDGTFLSFGTVILDQANSWLNFGDGEISLKNLARHNYGSHSVLTFATSAGSRFQSAHLVFTTASVPEPETYAMLLAGLGIVGAVARRRSKRG